MTETSRKRRKSALYNPASRGNIPSAPTAHEVNERPRAVSFTVPLSHGYTMRDADNAEKIVEKLTGLKNDLKHLLENPPIVAKYANVKQLAIIYGMSSKSVQNGIRAAMAAGKHIRAIAAPTGERKLPRYYIDDVTAAFRL